MQYKLAIIISILTAFLLGIIASPARAAFVDDKIAELLKEGDSLIRDGKYDEALKKYQEASDMNEEKADPHYKIGVAYYFLKDYKKAVESYKKAIRINPKYVKALNNLALIYDKQGEDTEAVIMYKKALDLKPDYKKARYNLGALLIRLEKLEEAEEQANKLVEMDPEYYKAYYLLGLIQEYREKYHRAEDMYLKALSINANFDRAVKGMKRVKEQMEKSSAYKKELEKARTIVNFKMLPEYRFLNVEEILSGSRVISLKYGDDQDIYIVKLPDSHILGDKSLEELLQDEKNEDFKNLLRDMKITAVELTGAGRFKKPETTEKTKEKTEDKKNDSGVIVIEKEEKKTEDKSKKDEVKNEEKKTGENSGKDENKEAGMEKPVEVKPYTKTLEYVQIKCVHIGSDREGVMVVFKPAADMDRMLFVSLAPLDKFSLSAARAFYNHIKAPKN